MQHVNTGPARTGVSLDDHLRRIVEETVRKVLLDMHAASASEAGPSIRNTMAGYLSIAKAARHADVAPGTIRAWIKAKRLRARRAGRVYRIAIADLEAFLAGNERQDPILDARARARDLARAA